jgi:DNA polymerase I-like protein with 3'-5' exonuclease and polymerase domains
MNIITTSEQLKELVDHYLTQDAFAFDVETVGDNRGLTPINEVLWITLATHGRCDVIPMGHPNGDFLEEHFPLTAQGEKRLAAGLTPRASDYSKDKKKSVKTFTSPPAQLYPDEVFTALHPLMFNQDILTIGHNLIFDITSIAKYYGVQIPVGPYFDTMIASFIVDNKNKNKCGLDDCLKREFGYEMVKGVGKEVEKYSFNEVAKYAYLDAKYTFLLWKVLAPRIEEDNLTKIMELEMGVLGVLAHMKLAGSPIDVEALETLDTKLREDIETSRAEIFRIAKRPFNINSNQEKQYLLYGPKEEGCQGLKPNLFTDAGKKRVSAGADPVYTDYSVASDALEPYRDSNPLVAALLEYADLNKLSTTYVVPYMGGEVVRTTGGKERREHKDSLLINGRLHCDFVQHGAETGRFSSRNPNLQNVPAPHTAHGKAIRNLFYAPEGYKLVVADYSQIEPRIIASMSEDPIMMGAYLEGADIYTTVGETMGVDRRAGKTLVLAMAYGVGPQKIAADIGCTVTDAKELLNNFSDKFSSVNSYKARVIGATRTKNPNYVATLLGRRRYLPEINSRDHFLRSQAERQAFNTRIQGSAADIIKLAMVRAHNNLPHGSSLILTVHDELVTLTPDSKADETVDIIREAMEGIDLLKIPLIADIKVVQRWGEAK